jgi:hypothetical protein
MTPFVSPTLLALAPYVAPALILIVAALAWLADWLLQKRRLWQVSLGYLILAGLVLQLAPLVLP